MSNYSVWVGGSEVNDYALTLEQATQWAEQYQAEGYEDVALTLVTEDWTSYKFRQWEVNA